MAEALARLADPGYLARYLRGDTQILGRQAGAVQVRYTAAGVWTLGALWIGNLDDRSGVGAPTVAWNAADNVTVLAAAFVPYGAGTGPAGVPRTEYGSAPVTAFLQVAVYD